MRLIDADALRDDLKESYDKLWLIYQEQATLMDREICKAELVTFNEVLMRLKDAPTIDAEPVRHGEWVDKGLEGDFSWQLDGRGSCWRVLECSSCGGRLYGMPGSDFCPRCGARLDGGKKEG